MTSRQRILAITVLAAATVLSACKREPNEPQNAVSEARLAAGAARVNGDYLASGGDGRDWAGTGFNYSGGRFSPLKAIDAETIENLGIAWFVNLPDIGPHDATPIVVDGVAYIATSRSKVAAYNVEDGELLWDYDPRVDESVIAPGGTLAGRNIADNSIALWKGRLFTASIDGRLSAVDAKTGVPLWSIQATEDRQPITTAPLVARNMVIIGTAGGNGQARGSISAYDNVNGTLRWRFYTTPNPDAEPDRVASDPMLAVATGTWSKDGDWRTTGGGGLVTGSIVYDAELDQLYFGTGAGLPRDYQARSGGSGDNLFLSSIVAIKPETGEYLWHFQTEPTAQNGFGATDPIILSDFTVDGRTRKLLLHPSSSGFLYSLDREDGALVSAVKLADDVTWARGYAANGRPVLRRESPDENTANSNDSTRLPEPRLDWRDGSAISINPQTGRIFVPIQRASRLVENPENKSDGDNGDPLPPVREAGSGGLIALAPLSGERIWATGRGVGGGTLATAGGIVFQGGDDGMLIAYSASDGEELWQYDLQGPIRGAPSTFLIGDRQMVAVMVGSGAVELPPSDAEVEAGNTADENGDAPPVRTGTVPARLVLFALGQDRKLPAPAPDAPMPDNSATTPSARSKGEDD